MSSHELDSLIPELRQYLAGPASGEGLIALLERHGLVLAEEEAVEYLEGCAAQCAYTELLEWPAASRSLH